ncbi:MAG TPA: hypothetical protein VER35_00685 [Candidatus Limnocylindrales bacterium]|nr:hypothetical protein [Candidatus Limnocylindrales bacterium]
MIQAQHKRLVVIIILMISLVLTATAQSGEQSRTDIIALLSIFINFPYSDHASGDKIYSINIDDIETVSQRSNDGSLRALKLAGKPETIKSPGFEPLLYLDIHTDNVNYSRIIIRVINEWNRSDLVIYHYKDDEWQPLLTTINGNYLQAVTGSLSVFAVGAQGGINIHLISDNLVMAGGNATIAGAAYFNNNSAASGINVEINPSWGVQSSTISDAQGNFQKILDVPDQPGNYTIGVNATSGIQNGTNITTIQVTNTSLFVINTSTNIQNTTVSDANISFSFPADGVPGSSSLSISLDRTTLMKVRMNNITIYNATTNIVNLNITARTSRS